MSSVKLRGVLCVHMCVYERREVFFVFLFFLTVCRHELHKDANLLVSGGGAKRGEGLKLSNFVIDLFFTKLHEVCCRENGNYR